MFAIGVDDGVRAEQEDARVPQETSRLQHFRRLRRIRLFDKAGQPLWLVGRSIRTRFEFEITIAGLCPGRFDAKGDQIPSLRPVCRGLYHRAEGRGIRDDMIRRRHQHQRLRLLEGQMQSRGQYRRASIAALRLDQDASRRKFDRGQLLGHDEAKRIARDHQRRGVSRPRKALCRGLKQALLPHQAGELLGI